MRCEQGIVDEEGVFVADARRMVDEAADHFGVQWDEDLVRLFARESAETYRILTARGVRSPGSSPAPPGHAVTSQAGDRCQMGAGVLGGG